MIKEIKESIAESVFSQELDDAYELGIRAGAEFAMRKIGFEVKLQKHIELTKTEQRGYDRSIEVIERVKEELRTRLGMRPGVNYGASNESDTNPNVTEQGHE